MMAFAARHLHSSSTESSEDEAYCKEGTNETPIRFAVRYVPGGTPCFWKGLLLFDAGELESIYLSATRTRALVAVHYVLHFG